MLAQNQFKFKDFKIKYYNATLFISLVNTRDCWASRDIKCLYLRQLCLKMARRRRGRMEPTSRLRGEMQFLKENNAPHLVYITVTRISPYGVALSPPSWLFALILCKANNARRVADRRRNSIYFKGFLFSYKLFSHSFNYIGQIGNL